MRFSLLSSALVRNSIHFSAELSGRDEEWSMKKIVDYMSEAGSMNGSCARPLSEQPLGGVDEAWCKHAALILMV